MTKKIGGPSFDSGGLFAYRPMETVTRFDALLVFEGKIVEANHGEFSYVKKVFIDTVTPPTAPPKFLLLSSMIRGAKEACERQLEFQPQFLHYLKA